MTALPTLSELADDVERLYCTILEDRDDARRIASALRDHATLTRAPLLGEDTRAWTESLILQMPGDHDGRNSWLLNHGAGVEADWHRNEMARYRAAWAEWREGYPQPQLRRYAALAIPAEGEGA